MADYDAIVVGSGFGGAVTACRLAESGARVLVLERGRRWTPETYPRTVTDPWFFDDRRPDRCNGWLDMRFFKGMMVAQGAGVGGGSLSYASVVMAADDERFESGWPEEVTAGALAPYYDRARRMLDAQTLPQGQETDRAAILRRAAERLGYAERYERVPLAVAFDPHYTYDQPDPIDPRHARHFTNAQGVTQATCVHLGNCHIGCDVKAKNTLDFNYLAAAEAKGAEVRPLHTVRLVEPAGSGYKVHWQCVEDGGLTSGSATADKVVLAAGSLGTTELLLRCRDQHGTLPNVSERLGESWSPNANFMTPAFYPESVKVNQGIGPLIASGLNFMDGEIGGQRFYVEDDGFPNVLLNALSARLGGTWFARFFRDRLRRGLDEMNPADRVMLWLGEGVDAGDGRLRLGRPMLAPWRKSVKLDWNVKESRAVFDAIVETHKRLSEVEGGRAKVPPFWRWFKWLTSVHPLGGCAMADSATGGVVDHCGEVFGHPNLYVADGAVIPRPIGRNPALTIAALAERSAAIMTGERQA
ncbi:GMC oxidoreductase [Ferruginivarius sediminum]|uniref:Cholesterol oxidase n=1 Tax=Ferruginivarius sediminum TaxID=2661937 RepID=A0A369T623_9PROT|nr:GMC family oxidoreductase [Ferruginivarius sediminum]RDD60770.1 GMC family oxidoreductase [Ferruginivarius sediminum]